MTSRTLESTDFELLARRFSALGDSVRLRILTELAGGRRCVCELLDEIGIAPNLLSYHLKVLRDAGLVDASRRGRWVDYSLAVDGLTMLKAAVPVAVSE